MHNLFMQIDAQSIHANRCTIYTSSCKSMHKLKVNTGQNDVDIDCHSNVNLFKYDSPHVKMHTNFMQDNANVLSTFAISHVNVCKFMQIPR